MKNLLTAAFAVSILSIPAHAAFVLGYQFGEGSGTTANDTADAPANNGTLLQGASFSTTSLSQTAGSGSLSLDGADDFVSIDGVGLLRNVSSYTLAAFIRLDSLGATAGDYENVIFFNNGQVNQAGRSRANLQVSGDGRLALGGRRDDGDGFARYQTAASQISLNSLYHVAATVTFSTTGNTVKLFIDGSLVSSSTSNGFTNGATTSDTDSQAAAVGRQGATASGISRWLGGRCEGIQQRANRYGSCDSRRSSGARAFFAALLRIRESCVAYYPPTQIVPANPA